MRVIKKKKSYRRKRGKKVRPHSQRYYKRARRLPIKNWPLPKQKDVPSSALHFIAEQQYKRGEISDEQIMEIRRRAKEADKR